MPSSKNILCFDFGEKRIGVALGNSFTKIAHPLLTIESQINTERFKIIENLLKKWNSDFVVVGIPLNDDGSENKLTKLARKLADKIHNKFNLPVFSIDERFTSLEAESILREQGIKIRKNKELVDQIAAKIILESYFRENCA